MDDQASTNPIQPRRRNAHSGRAVAALAMATVMALVGLSGVANAAPLGPDAKVKGAGVDDNALAFEFRAKSQAAPSGTASFETNSFGDPTGAVDCLHVNHRRAVIAGTIDNPTGGLTHYMIIMKDNHRHPGDEPDEIATWLRNGPFDCEVDGYGDLAESLDPIQSGRLRVTRGA